MTTARRIGLWLPVAAWTTVLYRLSAQSDLPGSGLVWDKLAHAVAYALLGVLCLRACHGGLRPLRLGPATLAVALTLGYGGLDEWHQSHVPHRDASVRDWLADACGAGAALLLVGGLTAVRPGRHAGPEMDGGPRLREE